MDLQERLLDDLVAPRSFCMTRLADHAEESGKIWEAAAWRWLIKYDKFPRKTRIRYSWTSNVRVKRHGHYIERKILYKIKAGYSDDLKDLLKRTVAGLAKLLEKGEIPSEDNRL